MESLTFLSWLITLLSLIITGLLIWLTSVSEVDPSGKLIPKRTSHFRKESWDLFEVLPSLATGVVVASSLFFFLPELLRIFRLIQGDVSVEKLFGGSAATIVALVLTGIITRSDKYQEFGVKRQPAKVEKNERLLKTIFYEIGKKDIVSLTTSLLDLDERTAHLLINYMVKKEKHHELLYEIIELIEGDLMTRRCLAWLRGLIHETLDDYWEVKGWANIVSKVKSSQPGALQDMDVRMADIRTTARILRFFDILISVIILFVLILVFPMIQIMVIAQLIYFRGKKSIFYASHRAGKGLENIKVFEFRTYRISDVSRKPEISRLGAFMIMSGLDKIPALINVLRGELSLVGPSPIYYSQFQYIVDKGILPTKQIATRHMIRPGLTGIAQIESLRDDFTTIKETLRRDLEYMENYSLNLYLFLLWNSVKLLFQYFLPTAVYLLRNWKGKLPPAEETGVKFPSQIDLSKF